MIMSSRWQRYKESLDGVIHQSFGIGLVGGMMLVATGNIAWRYHLDTNTNSIISSLEQMKMKYEIAGGVPYLLRDDVFLERLGVRNKYDQQHQQQTHWVRIMVQQEWNEIVYKLAHYLNQRCAKKFTDRSYTL
ncbi:unnamed protein product [Absidia cylindrospora]